MITTRQRLNATGIGLAGLEGVWWLPAVEPFKLPASLLTELTAIGKALFRLFDVVTELYGQGSELDALLAYKVPSPLLEWTGPGRVDSVRPDFQLVLEPTGHYRPVATELEICPSAHGFAQAMQAGYGLKPDLVEAFARYLAGRPLIFASSSQWSEFIWEQLAFCRALAGVGARGYVLYDLPIPALAESIHRGERWQPPMFGIKTRPPGWNDDLPGRLRAQGFEPFLWPQPGDWPASVGEAVVFRFGYVDCFGPAHLRRFGEWLTQGATLLNPAHFILDSKVVLATVSLPVVRERIGPDLLAVLDHCLPRTVLLQPERLARLTETKDAWVVKFAGFDGDNQAWGGRSLQLGYRHSRADWAALLEQWLDLPWPVVAQQIAPSAKVDIAYFDSTDRLSWLRQGTTRLRTFFLREAGGAVACGSHLTVAGSAQVSEATDAVQAPVVFC